jgi:spore coat polysaccharide biosynthesis predicted glycosyltransferase SpsG
VPSAAPKRAVVLDPFQGSVINTAPVIAIRFDADEEIGLGHWYRCVALAKELMRRKRRVRLLVNNIGAPLQAELRERGLDFCMMPQWTDDAFRRALEGDRERGCAIVLDTMNTSAEIVCALQAWTRVITIGGSGPGRDVADVRVDGMIPRPGYADRFVGRALYLGPEYVILREVFTQPVEDVAMGAIRRVFVALGGDAAGAGIRVARLLAAQRPTWLIDVMIGPLADVGLAPPSGATAHRNVANPRPLMERCDLAVCSGGMTTYELARLGKPVILLPQVALQDAPARAFEKAGLGFVIERELQQDDARFSAALSACVQKMEDLELRRQISATARRLVDGRGLDRVADIVERWTVADARDVQTVASKEGIHP